MQMAIIWAAKPPWRRNGPEFAFAHDPVSQSRGATIMKSKIISFISDESTILNRPASKDDFASLLGVTPKTLRSWERDSDADLPKSIAYMIKSRFREDILGPLLGDLSDAAFQKLPSEVVNIWVIDNAECILFSAGNRLAEVMPPADSKPAVFCDRRRRDVGAPTMLIPISHRSLTTYPARSAKTLNLLGDEIKIHPEKGQSGTRSASQFWDGVCENLLHVTGFYPGNFGPLPLCVLCFQNRLDPVTRQVGKMRYSPEEQAIALDWADKSVERLQPYLEMLDMIHRDGGTEFE
jgi:DNA-binding XRE family transcriptional regulator